VNTGNYFYEIYLRRENGTLIDNSDQDNNETTQTGLNSFCLVAREEI